MKKPIEQQIAELTYEQKNSLKDIYKKFLTSFIVVWVIAFLVGAGLFITFTVKAQEAKDRYDYLQTKIDLHAANYNWDFDLYDEKMDAFDEYYDMQEKKPLAFFAGGAVLALGLVLVLGIFKSKYPYFSEKKYSYLKKTGYYNNPQLQNFYYQNYQNGMNNYNQRQ